jgi:hypothetical protein
MRLRASRCAAGTLSPSRQIRRLAALATALGSAYRSSMQAQGYCPYCGEPIELWVDEGGAQHQRYVEDCAVCCHPIEVEFSAGPDDEEGSLSLRRGDE